jgi:hypothetical protein
MDFSRLTDPEAYKQALAGLLRRGKEAGDYIEQAPTKAGKAIQDAGERQSALMNKAFDPTGKTLIRDPQAANQAAINLFEGPMAFAPVGMTKPLTEKQFFKKYQQHIDLKNRTDQLGEERAKSIVEKGFNQGFGVNTLPAYRGGEPRNIIDQVFAPKKGDYVYLVPNEFADKLQSGYKVKESWMPKKEEMLKIESDYPSLYQEYLKFFQNK